MAESSLTRPFLGMDGLEPLAEFGQAASCPFCDPHDEREERIVLEWTARSDRAAPRDWVVTCYRCHCTGPFELSAAMAVKRWNHRAARTLEIVGLGESTEARPVGVTVQ